jgi:hypothetical protein
MRYQVTTKVSPQEAIEQALAYFGSQGVGLALIDQSDMCLQFEGGGGHVSIVACPGEKQTTLELETREWDYAVRQFMEQVS